MSYNNQVGWFDIELFNQIYEDIKNIKCKSWICMKKNYF